MDAQAQPAQVGVVVPANEKSVVKTSVKRRVRGRKPEAPKQLPDCVELSEWVKVLHSRKQQGEWLPYMACRTGRYSRLGRFHCQELQCQTLEPLLVKVKHHLGQQHPTSWVLVRCHCLLQCLLHRHHAKTIQHVPLQELWTVATPCTIDEPVREPQRHVARHRLVFRPKPKHKAVEQHVRLVEKMYKHGMPRYTTRLH